MSDEISDMHRDEEKDEPFKRKYSIYSHENLFTDIGKKSGKHRIIDMLDALEEDCSLSIFEKHKTLRRITTEIIIKLADKTDGYNAVYKRYSTIKNYVLNHTELQIAKIKEFIFH